MGIPWEDRLLYRSINKKKWLNLNQLQLSISVGYCHWPNSWRWLWLYKRSNGRLQVDYNLKISSENYCQFGSKHQTDMYIL